ncbi:Eco57I restriction-modification methylase domain-containing protein [Oligosphaera ethanolica]|uniref:site-specific DNA-methyltransferase (adenine-specific) n=1 Tax=Oligosphaera ethanolica TaxID=760260 RepID=A0AAE3VGC1_9BACT|nr:N-6 DNA methylase [Oligosphaera ethanolica]MDQ0290024.1 Alw26I/Eco31I/Esp3I family type II restriction m6 adenine DNA methyltransferase [Oligosphaera ethanolica]
MADVIQNMIAGMSKDTLGAFCRTKSGDFALSRTSRITAHNEALFPPVFQARFASVDIIGFFKNLEIFVFLIHLKNGSVLSERSCRRLQFDFARRVLSAAHNTQYSIFTEWLGDDAPANIDKALFVFTDTDGSFRFSLVENLDRNAETPKVFRRQTFFVDQEQSNNTFKKRMDLYRTWSSFNELKEVFSVEKLSDEFFTEYKNIYQDFVEYATGKRMVQQGKKWVETTVHSPRTEVMAQFEQIGDAEKAFRDYVKKMMGRLVFLQFLQKKGWLGVPEGREWGIGDKEYLRKLFKSKPETIQNDFLDTVLERLFFQSLNTDRTASNDIADELLSIQNGQRVRIPYLNGGLFENDVLDQTQVQFPKGFFEKLFDTFERFNFTIDENDPNDAEIGVDPEMLGRIFENLLEDNKDKGAFYTPKEIVQYMCRESLIAYLGDTLAVRKLVTDFDDSDIADSDKETLIAKLRTVKICDPAIGSGAFPMGMLHNVLNCRKQLEGIDDTPAEIVRLKSEIIQNNIYGVDIEAGAVDIARLRFWLSIVVDEIQPIPLPNLDYKIMQGNSLLESYNGVELALDLAPAKKPKCSNANPPVVDDQMCLTWDDEAAAIENIKDAIHAFFSPRADVDKNTLRTRIDAAVKEYIKTKCGNVPAINLAVDNMNLNNKSFFLWHLYFADVFASGGFDIVIGNPPYNELRDLSSEMQESYKNSKYFEHAKEGRVNLFQFFYPLAIDIAKIGSVICMITQNSLLAEGSALGNRKYIISSCDIIRIDSFPERDNVQKRVFESAKMSVCIGLFRRNNKSDFSRSFAIHTWKDRFFSFKSDLFISKQEIKQIFPEELIFPISSKEKFDLVKKMRNIRNKHCIGCSAGEIDMKKYKNEFTADSQNNFRVVTGAQVQKYYITDSPSQGGVFYLSKRVLSELSTARQTVISQERIAMQRITGVDSRIRLIATIVPPRVYLANSTNYILPDNILSMQYILAVMNSKLLNFYLKQTSTNTNVTAKVITQFPIPIPSKTTENHIISIVKTVLTKKKVAPNFDTHELEVEVDQLIYQLYNLTSDEISLVEESHKIVTSSPHECVEHDSTPPNVMEPNNNLWTADAKTVIDDDARD